MSLGTLALDYALDYCGACEEGGNNRGPWVLEFCGTENVSWCAGFVGRCLDRATESVVYPPVKRSLGAQRLAENLLKYDQGHAIASKVRVDHDLRAGDIVVWKRTGPGTTKQSGHIGIVHVPTLHGFISIEGNVGSYASTKGMVRPIFHHYDEHNFLYGVRLP